MERSAVAYRANGTIVIAPIVRTTSGLGLEVEPASLGRVPDEESVARALADALARSDRVVAHPAQSEWKGFFQRFLDASGVKSRKAFMKDARRVSLEAIGGELTLTPDRNLGDKEGFEPIFKEVMTVPGDDWRGAAVTLLRLLDGSSL